jgi:hypothetical protein
MWLIHDPKDHARLVSVLSGELLPEIRELGVCYVILADASE